MSVTFDVPVVPTLATTLSADKAIYLTNQTATLTARVTADGSAAPGASVTLTVTLPTGQKRTFSGVTDTAGLARFWVKIAKRDPKGTWQAGVLASDAGASASAASDLYRAVTKGFSGSLTKHRASITVDRYGALGEPLFWSG